LCEAKLFLDNVAQPKLLDPTQAQQFPQAEWLSIVAKGSASTNCTAGKTTEPFSRWMSYRKVMHYPG
jgi:hypothetical protein